MMSQELLTKVNEDAPVIDYECPDCQSLLTICYDNDRPRYFCENCGQETGPLELGRDDGDNHISDDAEANRGIF